MSPPEVTALADLPASIQVGPFRYEIVCDQATIDRVGQDAHANLLGQHSPRQGRIALLPDMPHDLESETLLHEVLHAIFEATGIGGGDGDDSLLDSTAEERLIRQCSPMLLDTLRRNPKLVAYLAS